MGYNFRSALNLQVQTKPSIRQIAETRFTITGSAGGGITVTTTREATGAERAARRQSARETSGLAPRAVEVGDYVSLPASNRDVFLTGSHGLTSLYPNILLTTPRTSKVVDTDTGLTTTPLVIDLNNAVKKTIESNVKAAIDQYGSTIQLNTNQYDQNVSVAKQYADLCLQTSIAKDNLIKLFNVINLNVATQEPSQNYVINGKNYEFLGGKQSVFDFLKEIDEFSQIQLEDLAGGTNTKNLAQIFKFLTEQFVLGATEVDQVRGARDITKTINGRNSKTLVSMLKDLQTINTETRFTGTPGPGDRASDVILDDISTSDYSEATADNITNLIKVIQRDLLMQSLRTELTSLTGVRTRNIEDTLAQIVGKYKDIDGQTTPFSESLNNGIDDVDVLIQNGGVYDVDNLLVADLGTRKFGKLDAGEGVDYLIYNDLAQQNRAPDFQNLIDFANAYLGFTIKLKSFYQKTYRDDEVRKTVVKLISDTLLSFINGSKINTENIASDASATRIGFFMAAAFNSDIAKKLFRLMCALDKKNNYGATAGDESPYSRTLQSAIDGLISDDTGEDRGRLRPPRGDTRLYQNVTGDLIDLIEYEVSIDDVSIEEEYLVGTAISFLDFHNIARKLEQSIYPEGYAEGERSKDDLLITDFSLNLTRDARAFVFYQNFLHIIRHCYYDLSIDDYGDYELRFSYKPGNFKTLKFIAENYDANLDTFQTRLQNFVTQLGSEFAAGPAFFTNATNIRNKYFAAPIEKINAQEQRCLDLINIAVNHAMQIKELADSLKQNTNSLMRAMEANQIQDKTSLLNDIQAEQAFLKKNIVDRYFYPLRGATYLPSAIDHNVNQALNVKTVVATLPAMNDQLTSTSTDKFIIVVGIPTGLLENLRYQNTTSVSEHLYSIDLVFKNVQIEQKAEDENLQDPVIPLSYTFSSRIFVNEGYQLAGGADVVSSTLTNYEQIYNATKYKFIDEDGNYLNATPSELETLLGDRKIIDNHLISHYAKLFLKTTSGITLDEESFDLVPQTRVYPDVAQNANYTTIVDLISANYPDTPEGRLNRARATRDLSRSIQLAPEQHKISMMSSKLFERILAIPVDIKDVSDQLQIMNNDIAFISVIAKVRLEDSQPPMSVRQSPTRRSYAQAVTNVAESFKQTDIRSQGADAVGLNKMIEISSRFGGFMNRGNT